MNINDIAKHLDVSTSTVSRALNNRGRLSQELRGKIIAYAAEVNYQPNAFALSLKNQHSNTIGIIIPDITNVYNSIFFKYVEEFIKPKGYRAILYNCDEKSTNEDQYVEYMLNSQVDGMIVASTGSSAWEILEEDLLNKVVFVDNLPQISKRINFVGCDNEKAAYDLTEHLVKKGYTKIATLVGSIDESTAKDRLTGYLNCLRDNHLEINPEWIINTGFLYEDGYKKSQNLLSLANTPDSVLAQNNVLAYGILRAAQEVGLRIPEDMAIVCFDHIDLYGFMRPRFTSMMQPVYEIAEKASSMLLKKLNYSSKTYKNTQIILTADLSIGETS